MSVSIGKGLTFIKSVGSGNVSVHGGTSELDNIAIAGRIAQLAATLGALTLTGTGTIANPAILPQFRTQYIIASSISTGAGGLKVPIPIPITTNSRAFITNSNSKLTICGAQDVSAEWTAQRDGNLGITLISNNSVLFTRNNSTLFSAMAGACIIEYVGVTGDANDIQSLLRCNMTLVTGQNSDTTTLPITPTNPYNVVPFILGMETSGGTTNARSCYAYVSAPNELHVINRPISS